MSVDLFVSPHLDDAVFACGERIAASDTAVVVTVFAGFGPDAPLTPWDRACGFAAGDDVVALRRAEDRAALTVLGGTPEWLDFRDDQYREPRTTADIARSLACAIDRHSPHAIHVPLGLFHADHRRASDAASTLVAGTARWWIYADAIYRRIPGAVDERLGELARVGFALTPLASAPREASARKREAIACYRSQLRALGRRPTLDDVYAPERYWTLAREPVPR